MFQKGQSGNPAGPAKGTRHKITMLAWAMAVNIVAMELLNYGGLSGQCRINVEGSRP